MSPSANAARLVLLVAFGVASGYLWRAALEPAPQREAAQKAPQATAPARVVTVVRQVAAPRPKAKPSHAAAGGAGPLPHRVVVARETLASSRSVIRPVRAAPHRSAKPGRTRRPKPAQKPKAPPPATTTTVVAQQIASNPQPSAAPPPAPSPPPTSGRDRRSRGGERGDRHDGDQGEDEHGGGDHDGDHDGDGD